MRDRWGAADAMLGAFVLIGAAVIIGATVWVRQADLGRRSVETVARFRDVGNARIGTGVFVRGVRAGRVSALELADDGWVRARFALDPEVRLPEDAVIVLGASTLFGEWQAVVTSRAAAPEHPDVDRQLAEASGEAGTLPGATLPDVAQLTTVAGRIADDVGAVAGRVRVAFDDSAARELRATISNTAALSATLASAARRQTGTLDAVSADVRAAARALAEAGERARRAAQRADTATAGGQVEDAVQDVATAAADVKAAAAELRALVQRTAATQVALDRAVASADTLLARARSRDGTLGRLLEDPSLYRNADSLAIELRALIADVRANPRRYVQLRVF